MDQEARRGLSYAEWFAMVPEKDEFVTVLLRES